MVMVLEYQKEKKCPDLWHVRNCEIISNSYKKANLNILNALCSDYTITMEMLKQQGSFISAASYSNSVKELEVFASNMWLVEWKSNVYFLSEKFSKTFPLW